jgi:high-affinity Fe2+/Pb2+ permease
VQSDKDRNKLSDEINRSVRAGILLVSLAIAIMLAIISLAFQGLAYFQWAAFFFGLVAGGLLATGLYLLIRR